MRALALILLLLATPAAAEAQPSPAPSPAPGGVHTLILVRHGAYDEDDPADPDVGRALVPMGRRQAALVGARLAALPKPDSLTTSTMTRARETAAIIGLAIGLSPQPSRDIRECLPTRYPSSGRALTDDEKREAAECDAQIERAAKQWLVPTPAKSRTDVLVAHGNVIRSLVVRALGIDRLMWNVLGITHTGVTVIEIPAEGKMKVISYNDAGHLPAELQTRGGMQPLMLPVQ